MTNVLLVSEKYIKTHSQLNDNVWGEYLTPGIVTAQDINLQETIGSCLYQAIIGMVADGTITDPENSSYKYLLDNKIRPYLMWQTIANLVPIVGVKLDNLGTIVSNDQHTQNLTEANRNLLERRYTFLADSYRKQLQLYLKNNREQFPELEKCSCEGIPPCLNSSNSSALWLGGLRSRKV